MLGPRQKAAQSGEQGPVSRSKRRPSDLPTKDSNLVTKDDDLDCQIGGVTALQSQEFEHPDEGGIEEGQGHHPPSLAWRRYRNSPAQGRWMTVSAPTGQQRRAEKVRIAEESAALSERRRAVEAKKHAKVVG